MVGGRQGMVRRSARMSARAACCAAALLTAVTVAVAPAGAAGATSSAPPAAHLLSPRLSALAEAGAAGTSAQPNTSNGFEVGVGGLPASGPGSFLRHGDGRVVVDVRTTTATQAQPAAIAANAQIITHDGQLSSMAVAPQDLGALAASAGVESVSEELTPKMASSGRAVSGAAQAADAPPACPTGPAVTGGDGVLRADLARATNGVDGTGVKVGILSDSYDNLGGAAADVAAGELPGVGNPCGYTTPVQVLEDLTSSGGIDEGRGMAQIVHDLAPGAQLLFATGFNGQQDFAAQIVALKDAGATVIVDDITYFSEPMYQDGVIAAAVDQVEAAGVSYFSSAGNNTYTLDGHSVGSYEAPAYRPTACPASVLALEPGVDCHNFNPDSAGAPDPTDGVTLAANSGLHTNLGWNEPQQGITDDFDLFYLSPSGDVVASSTDDNVASGVPWESVAGTVSGSYAGQLVIARKSGTGTPSVKWIDIGAPQFTYVEWNTSARGDVMGPTIYGHNGALAAASVAAVPAYDPTTPEYFSSQGPVRYCWAPVSGTTPSPAIPCVSKTVDFTATDGAAISDTTGLYNPFFGTSAAAPHAAAINALMRQAQPCRTNTELLAAEVASGRPIANTPAPAVDTVGSGLLDAQAAIAGLAACPGPPPPHVVPGGGTVAAPASGTADLAVAVTLSAPSNRTVTAKWTTLHVPGAAANPVLGPQAPLADYTASSGTVTFAPGQTTGVVHIPVISDSSPGPDEYVLVSFSNATNASVGGFWGLGFGVITHDEPVVTPGSGTVAAPSSGTADLAVPVTLSGPSAVAVTVQWSTLYVPGATGNQAPVADYTAVSGTVTFAPGQTSAVVHIPVIADSTPGPNEVVLVSFSNPTNARMGGIWGLGFGLITPAT